MARTIQHHEYTDQPTRAPLLRWSSVFGGVVIGGALLLLLSTLWLALAEATGVQAIADGLGWFIAASAIVALFVGGWLAAALSGVPGLGPGIMNGLAVWGVILVLSAVAGTPGLLGAMTTPGLEIPTLDPGQALWPAFWSLLIGALTAGIGGAIGGLTTRGEPAVTGSYVEQRPRGMYRDEADERGWGDYGDRREYPGRGERRDYGERREAGARRETGERREYADRQEYGNGHDRERERIEEERRYEAGDRGYPEGRGQEPMTPSERAYAERRRDQGYEDRGPGS